MTFLALGSVGEPPAELGGQPGAGGALRAAMQAGVAALPNGRDGT